MQHMVFMLDRMSGAMAYHRNKPDAIQNILKWKNGDRFWGNLYYAGPK